MFCSQCGAKFADGSAFCPQCGTPAEAPKPIAEEPIYEAPAQSLYEEPVPQPVYEAPVPQPVYEAPVPQPVYAQPAPAEKVPNPPARQHATRRGLLKYFFLGIITLGIYDMVVLSRISCEINLVAQKDGRKTIHYLSMLMLSVLSFFVVPLVWWHNLCNRMGNELSRRNLGYSFGARHFWLLNILGGITIVCPLIFMYKFFKASNKLNKDYNVYGA